MRWQPKNGCEGPIYFTIRMPQHCFDFIFELLVINLLFLTLMESTRKPAPVLVVPACDSKKGSVYGENLSWKPSRVKRVSITRETLQATH